jgi:ATP-dependent DNA ligase
MFACERFVYMDSNLACTTDKLLDTKGYEITSRKVKGYSTLAEDSKSKNSQKTARQKLNEVEPKVARNSRRTAAAELDDTDQDDDENEDKDKDDYYTHHEYQALLEKIDKKSEEKKVRIIKVSLPASFGRVYI